MRAAVAALLALALAACGGVPDTVTRGSDGLTIEVTFVDGKVYPRKEFIDATVGVPINLHVISDVDEKIHVHADPQQTFDVAAGDDKTFTFTIDRVSDATVEAHNLNVTIAQLVVGP